MPNLKIQRSVSEGVAAFHAFATTDTQFFIDGVFKIGVFDICPLDSPGRTELAFRSGVSGLGIGLEIPAAQVAVAAHRVGMNTFHRRVGQHTIDRAFFTLDTDVGIYLPDHLLGGRLFEQ
jgi:hypothetical protein